MIVGVAVAFAAISAWTMSCGPLTAQPRAVIIIRHAEKPLNSADPNLTPRGYERATALVKRFSTPEEHPDFLFAAKRSKHSDRPVETLLPLARALHVSVNSNIPDSGYAFLARDILTNHQYDGKTVLICWHHHTIPALAKALGAGDPPKSWPDRVFDRMWRIRFSGNAATLDILPQHLLPGDAPE